MSNLLDGITSAFLLFVFALTCIFAYWMFSSIDDTGILGSYSSSFGGFYTALNNTFIFLAIALALVPVAAALFIRTHPFFFLISLFFLIVQLVVTPIFVNAYNTVAQQSPAATQNALNLQIQIMQILPALSVIGTLLAIIVGLAAL